MTSSADHAMRILVWHGYLLGGTGSNVYTRALAREWARAGHDVTSSRQEPHPERFDLGGATAVRPDVGRAAARRSCSTATRGYDVRLLQDCSRSELDAWVEANAAVVRELLPADLVFANHVLLGGAVGARRGARYAVKAHGSELEYSMRGNAELEEWGREVLGGAAAVFVGSQHIREVSRRSAGTSSASTRFRPGVDVDEWRPAPRDEALAALLAEARLDPPNPGNANERLPTRGTRERLRGFLAGDGRRSSTSGSSSTTRACTLLLEALARLDARAVVVGFGDYRAELEQPRAGPRALFTGPLEHRHLVHLLALADACVVPSIFPEAFGMVAAEAAAAGARRSSRATPASPRSPRGSRRSTRPSSGSSRVRDRGRRRSRARSCPSCSRWPEPTARGDQDVGTPRRGRALELGERRRDGS